METAETLKAQDLFSRSLVLFSGLRARNKPPFSSSVHLKL
jgi:hypothetical protein